LAGPPVVAMTQSDPTRRQFRIVRVETMAVAAADPCCDHGPHAPALALALLAGDGARELVDQAPSAVIAAMIAPVIKAIRIVRNSASLLPDARWLAATR